MTVAEGKRELEAVVAAGDPQGRLARLLGFWSTVLEFRLDGEERPFHLVVDRGQLTLEDGAHIMPNTVLAGDAAAFAPVARGDLDITHPIAQGRLRLVKGDYFDLLNLSKAIGAIRKGR